MKKLGLLLSLISISAGANELGTDKQYSVGVGIGSAYSGLGANVALVSRTDMKYLSAGCVEYSSNYGLTCGFGAGWIVTDLFNSNSNKHGLGVYVTKAGHETNARIENGNLNVYESEYHGAGVSYTYFMNGIDKPGFTFGVSAHATNSDYDDSTSGVLLQVGYQF